MSYINEKKITHAAAYLLKKRGNRMSYMKLLKLLYLTERNILEKYGYSFTSDRYVAMQQGMVLSNTLSLINGEFLPEYSRIWDEYISEPQGKDVLLKKAIDLTALSEAEIEELDKVYAEFGYMNRWEIVDYIHDNLKEWKDPNGSMIPVSREELLNVISDNSENNKKVLEEIEEQEEIRKLFEMS
jgi:uncharacterized phage-associated protein